LLIAQTKVINETFLKFLAIKAHPYFKKPWLYLWLSFISESNFDDGEDGGDAKAATAGSISLHDPEGHPGADDHHEQGRVNLGKS